MQAKQTKSNTASTTTKTAETAQKATIKAGDAARIPAWANAQSNPINLQTKLTINQPGDIYEQEADRVAEHIMRMPTTNATSLAQTQDKTIMRKEDSSEVGSSQGAPPIVNQTLNSGGQPLDSNTRAMMEPRFGQDFSDVRIHTDRQAEESAQAVNALAYTVGSDVVFGARQYRPSTNDGQKLLAHELTHVLQHSSEGFVRRAPDTVSPPVEDVKLTNLRQLLKDDKEDAAIDLMGHLHGEEAETVLKSSEFEKLAISAFSNKEMYRAVLALHGDLYPSLVWMFEEGTDWTKVKDVIEHAPFVNDHVRINKWMMEQFVDICNNKEMAEAVDLLGGTLLQKLTWMKAEGSDWNLVKARVQSADPTQRAELYGSKEMLDLFVDVCNNKEMAEAVDLLDGTLLQKLTWMKEEGSDWGLVKARVQAADVSQRVVLYNSKNMLDLFVDVCNNKEMAEAVILIGGTLLQKLTWMLAEGTDASLVYNVIRLAPSAELLIVYINKDVFRGLQKELSQSELSYAMQMLKGLPTSQNINTSYSEQHYEQDSTTFLWTLKVFNGLGAYEIQYTGSALKIIVRIRLTGVVTTPDQRNTWITGIQSHWSNKFHLKNGHKLDIVFEPSFTNSNFHHTVQIHNPPPTGTPREDEGNWYASASGYTTSDDVVAHEFGHMLGLQDEYHLTSADYTSLTGSTPPASAIATPAGSGYTTTGLMGTPSGSVEKRYLKAFVDWLNVHLVPGEHSYRIADS